MTVRLVTDSGANLPAQWVEDFGVGVVDIHRVMEEGRLVSTAAPTPAECAAVYDEMLSTPDCTGVVSVHMSSKLSRTWESAAEAATGFGGRVLVVDSRSAGMATGGAAAQAAWAARTGAGLSATYDLAERLCRGTTSLVAVDSLDSLRRGGRIGGAVALIGGVLAMKPILELRDGQLGVAAKTRTTGKAHQRLRALVRDELTRGDALVCVHHSGPREAADEIADEIRRETPNPERIVVVEFDEVLGWHLGEGTVAVCVSDLVDPEFPIPGLSPQAGP